MSIDFTALSAPFDPAQVSWRLGRLNGEKTKGQALAYLDARDVMDRLDAVCGPAQWQCDYPHANAKTVCRIGLLLDAGWVWKADGAGDSDIEAEKGALSDAFKRAAVRWGIGRYLYDLPSPWVVVEQKGRTHFIAEGEKARLRNLLVSHKPTPASIVAGAPRLHTNGKPAVRSRSQELADELRADLWKRQGHDAIERWLQHDGVRRELESLDEADRSKILEFAEERRSIQ